MIRLTSRFPQLKNFHKLAPKIHKELQPYYEEYISRISSDEMAISLELSVFLLMFCNIFKPKSILDLGSGFSSFVFRYYSAQAKPKPLVWSVDDNSQWLKKTREFLIDYDLSAKNLDIWNSFCKKKGDPFDFILHDLDGWEQRKATLEDVVSLIHPAGIIILDDLHKKPYASYVKQVLEKHNLIHYNLKSYTQDKFGRYSMLVMRQGRK